MNNARAASARGFFYAARTTKTSLSGSNQIMFHRWWKNNSARTFSKTMRQRWHHLVAESQNPGENPLQISTWPIPTTGLLSVYSSWNMQRAPFLHDREWTTTELANAAVLIAVAGVSLATVSLTSRRLRYTRNVNRRFSVRPFYQSWASCTSRPNDYIAVRWKFV